MAITLKLKIRDRSGNVSVNLAQLRQLLAEGKDRLWEFFEPLKESEQTVHDKEHLLTIINWVPGGGLPLSEQAKWFKLVGRVNGLDEEREGNFTLSEFQKDLLWQRMNNEQFKMRAMSPAFVGFVMDFQKATGLHFKEEEPDEMQDEGDGESEN